MLNISNFGFSYKINGHLNVTPTLQIEGHKIGDLDVKTVQELGNFGLQKRVVFFIKGTDQRLNTYFAFGKDTTLGEVTSENICNSMSIREIENQRGKLYKAVSREEAEAWEAENSK